jgi:hypothetical protein
VLDELEQEVTGLRFAPAAQVRARGEQLRRHRTAAGVAAAVVVSGVIGVPLLAPVGGAPPLASPGSASPTSPKPFDCVSPAPTSLPPAPDGALIRSGAPVRILLTDDVTAAQVLAINARLHSIPAVDEIFFSNRTGQWQTYADVYCHGYPNGYPQSFLVGVPSEAYIAQVRAALIGLPGVAEVALMDPWGAGS